jgi:hypothetical protein
MAYPIAWEIHVRERELAFSSVVSLSGILDCNPKTSMITGGSQKPYPGSIK